MRQCAGTGRVLTPEAATMVQGGGAQANDAAREASADEGPREAPKPHSVPNHHELCSPRCGYKTERTGAIMGYGIPHMCGIDAYIMCGGIAPAMDIIMRSGRCCGNIPAGNAPAPTPAPATTANGWPGSPPPPVAVAMAAAMG